MNKKVFTHQQNKSIVASKKFEPIIGSPSKAIGNFAAIDLKKAADPMEMITKGCVLRDHAM